MDMIKVRYGGKVIPMLRQITTSELAALFHLQTNGMHLKVRMTPNGSYESIYPHVNIFHVSESVAESILIGVPQQEEENNLNTPVASSSSSSTSMSTYGRRGNSALQALQGSRAVPSLKRKFGSSFTLPSKKKENIIKTISVSDVENDKIFTYYEVPIDLGSMTEINVRTIQEAVKNQIGGEDFILTNKKGNPIRDMPNTRGNIFL